MQRMWIQVRRFAQLAIVWHQQERLKIAFEQARQALDNPRLSPSARRGALRMAYRLNNELLYARQRFEVLRRQT